MTNSIATISTALIFSFFICFQALATPPPAYLIKGSEVVTGTTYSRPAQQMVVAFVSAKCPCSDSHVGELADLAKSYPEFEFVGVNSNGDEDAAMAKAYFKKAALGFPVVRDERFQIADHFKALKTPHVYVLDAAGEVVYRGGVTDSKDCNKAGRKYLREALEDLKNNRAVANANVRALGCTISRKTK